MNAMYQTKGTSRRTRRHPAKAREHAETENTPDSRGLPTMSELSERFKIGDRVSYYRKPHGSKQYTGIITDITPGVIETQPDHRKRGVHYIATKDIDSEDVVINKISEKR